MKGWNTTWLRYAKYYSFGRIKILRSSEFTRENDHNKRDFSGHW
jgi:hypothetical protein